MKTKFYFVVPLALVSAFAVFFVDFKHRYDAAQNKAAVLAEENRKSQAAEENRRREIAQIEAINRATKLKQARDAQHALEEREKTDRADLLIRRDAAQSEVARLTREKEKLTRAIAEEQSMLDRAEADRAKAEAERTFLRNYIAAAHESIARIDSLVARVEEARQTAITATATSR